MRPIRSLLIYLAVVFVGGALLAPWLYALAQWAASHWPAFQKLTHNPFHRFVDRSLLGLALLGLWPLLRNLKMLHWRDLGLTFTGRPMARIACGFALGFVSLALVAFLGTRNFNFHHTTGELIRFLSSAVLAAIIVAILEELLFRGALFGALRRAQPWWLAAILSSAVYAAVHFLQKADLPGPVTWSSGLALLPQMARNLGDVPSLIPAFFTLLLAGMILALAYQRTGTLFFSIGLHAGWIFWLKSYQFISQDTLVNKWLAIPVLLCVLWIVARRPKEAGC